jgi:hypothetical protein
VLAGGIGRDADPAEVETVRVSSLSGDMWWLGLTVPPQA